MLVNLDEIFAGLLSMYKDTFAYGVRQNRLIVD